MIKCVELPVATQGESKEEALANLKEAIEGYLVVKANRLSKQTKGERVEVIVEAQITESEKNPNIGLIEQIAEKNIELTRMLATNGKSKKSNRFTSLFFQLTS